MFAQTTIFDRKINLVAHRNFDLLVDELADNSARSVFFCNVHMLMLSMDDTSLAEAMSDADVIFADGVPVVWLQRWLSGKSAKVIRGYELMQAICKHASLNGERVGFMGSSDEVVGDLVKNLSGRYPSLQVVYQHSPDYVRGELDSSMKELQEIRGSGVDWLFVGLGCPKQEKWTARYSKELDCKVLAVGAAFDWLAGTTAMPPRWMESVGLGWLFRLFQNPRKMWKRYFLYNSKFISKVLGFIILNSRRSH